MDPAGITIPPQLRAARDWVKASPAWVSLVLLAAAPLWDRGFLRWVARLAVAVAVAVQAWVSVAPCRTQAPVWDSTLLPWAVRAVGWAAPAILEAGRLRITAAAAAYLALRTTCRAPSGDSPARGEGLDRHRPSSGPAWSRRPSGAFLPPVFLALCSASPCLPALQGRCLAIRVSPAPARPTAVEIRGPPDSLSRPEVAKEAAPVCRTCQTVAAAAD